MIFHVVAALSLGEALGEEGTGMQPLIQQDPLREDSPHSGGRGIHLRDKLVSRVLV